MNEQKKIEILEEAIERARIILGVDPAYYGEEGEEEVDRQLEKMGYNPKDFYKYEERLDLLMESLKSSKLNDEEFTMIYGILKLSKDRNEFNTQYNTRTEGIIKKDLKDRKENINMEIREFRHDSNNGTIEFTVEHKGEMNKVEMESTGRGTTYTDIDDFTDGWTNAEYNQLEEFMDGCLGLLHQFYHG